MTDLPETWELVPLDAICEFNPKHHPDTLRDTIVSFVPMSSVSEVSGSIVETTNRPLSKVWKGYTHFREGDVLFAKITPCMENGKSAIAKGLSNGLGCGSTEFHVLRPSKGVDPAYVWYFLRQEKYRKVAEQAMTGAVGQRRVTENYVKSSLIPIAPTNEQRRIVEKLDNLLGHSTRARDKLDYIPRLIERYKQAVLTKAFRGELTADWRNQNRPELTASRLVEATPAPQQSRGGRSATESVTDGRAAMSINVPDRKAPKGWAWVNLRRIARQETGHTPSRKRPEYWGGDIPWIGIADANEHHGKVIEDTHQHVTQAGLENSSARLLPAGTVCLSRTASVGYVIRMGRDMATSQDFVTWTCSEALDPEYLMYALLAEGDNIRRFGKGSTHKTIYFPEVRAFHICLAPLEEQKEIVHRVKTALAWIDRIGHEHGNATQLLRNLDQAVLAKAFRGELVPQDPEDVPASGLLERIQADPSKQFKPNRGRKKVKAKA